MMDPLDGGWASPKLVFAAATSLLIVGCMVVAGVWSPAAAQLPTVVGGLISVLAIFTGGHTAAKWVIGKHNVEHEAVQNADKEEVTEGEVSPKT